METINHRYFGIHCISETWTYQFDCHSIVGNEIGREVYTTMGSLSYDIHQLISFTEDSWYLSLNIYKFTIHICFITWIRCACSLLGRTRHSMLARITYAHLVAGVGTCSWIHQVVVLAMSSSCILDASVDGIELFLSFGGVAEILCLVCCSTLKITTLIIEMLEH